jgi:ribosomal protein S15P/S13E
MNTNDLRNAVRFLEKVFVGQVDEELLVTTIKNLNNEIRKREKDERRTR